VVGVNTGEARGTVWHLHGRRHDVRAHDANLVRRLQGDVDGGRCRVHPCHCCVPVVIVFQYRGEVSQLLSQFMVATESEASRSTTAQCRLRTTQAAARFFLR
jgi:hypothetical protein